MTGLSDMNIVLSFHFCSPCKKNSNKAVKAEVHKNILRSKRRLRQVWHAGNMYNSMIGYNSMEWTPNFPGIN